MYVCVRVPACRRLIDQAYSPFHAVLHCGNLSSDVQVFPRPEPVVVDDEVDPMPRVVNTGSQSFGSRRIYVHIKITKITTDFPHLSYCRLGDCGIH